MWEFGSVSLEMNFKVPFGCESGTTNITLERPFTCVRTNVYLQRRIASKNFSTISTAVLEEGFISSSGFSIVGRHFPGFSESKFIGKVIC